MSNGPELALSSGHGWPGRHFIFMLNVSQHLGEWLSEARHDSKKPLQNL